MKQVTRCVGWKTVYSPVLLICAAAGLFAACSTFDAKLDVRRGNELYANGMYLEAIDQYKKALEHDPHIALAQLNTAMSYFMLVRKGAGDKEKEYTEKAVQAFDDYLKLVPSEEKKIREYQLNVYIQTKQYDKAVDLLKAKLEKTPNDLETIKAIANIYSNANRFDEALEWNKKAALVDSKNPEAFYTIGVMCWQKSYYGGQMDPEVRTKYIQEGMDALTRAISMKSNYFEGITYLGLLYREQAKIETDETKKEELLAKAQELQNQAIELKKSMEKKEGAPEEKKAEESTGSQETPKPEEQTGEQK
jgi:tetratricopeptide (TPR) repeat protein